MSCRTLVGLQFWSEQRLDQLRATGRDWQGIVLGDPFCPRRMFQDAEWDIPFLCQAARQRGFEIAIQTPVYLPPPKIGEVFNLVRSLERRGLVDLLLVQDVGLLDLLRQSACRVPICWTLWAHGRANAVSRDLLDFLCEEGIAYFETQTPSHVARLQEYGLKVVYRHAPPCPTAFGRVCYTEHVLGTPCKGPRLCREDPLEIVSANGSVRLRVDGHVMLGPVSRDPRPPCDPEYLLVHAADVQNLPGTLYDG